jgi:AcrR family transcriptional regulator
MDMLHHQYARSALGCRAVRQPADISVIMPSNEMTAKRRYQQRERARRHEETRQRIVDALVELHETVGAAQTTVVEVARRAGVGRMTVYNHFATEAEMVVACTSHWIALHPPPDVEAWRRIADPETRLRVALAELYAHYARNERQIANVLRDLDALPALRRLAGRDLASLRATRDVLAGGRRARGRRRTALLSALGHAIDFETWRSLVRREGLEQSQAVELMVSFVRCAGDSRDPRA